MINLKETEYFITRMVLKPMKAAFKIIWDMGKEWNSIIKGSWNVQEIIWKTKEMEVSLNTSIMEN